MKYYFLIIFSFLWRFAATQNGNTTADLGAAGGDACTQLAPLPNGFVVAGIFQQNINLAGNNYNTIGGFDIFICWYDSNGTAQQALTIGNNGNNELTALDSDRKGNLYLSGTFSGTLDLGIQSLQSAGISHFIIKINPQRQVIWAERLYGSNVNDLTDLQLDSSEQYCWISGAFNDSLRLGKQALHSKSASDFFVAKMQCSTGQTMWMQKSLRAKDAKAWTLTPMPDGTAWVALEFTDSLYTPFDTFFRHPSHTDIALLQFDSNGQNIQSKCWGGVHNDRPKKMRLAPDGQHFWMVGEFVGILQIDQIRLITARRYYDVFWVKINRQGQALAAGQSNTQANAYVYDLALSNSELWMSGYFQDSLMGQGLLHLTNGGFDAFRYRIATSDASLRASETWGGKGNDNMDALCVSNKKLIAAGTFQQQMLVNGQTLIADGFSDGWLFCEIATVSTIEQETLLPILLKIKLIPNPSNSSFLIELPEPMPLRWELYALNGKRVLMGTDTQIKAATLPTGVYSLTVYTDKGMAVEKLIKK